MAEVTSSSVSPDAGDTGFAFYLLSTVDLFDIWWCISLATGIAVLYRRRTGPVAAVLFGIYAVVALLIATIRTFA